MVHRITVLPQNLNIDAAEGENLLEVLRHAGLSVNAPCGGNGSCGKCKVLLDGRETLACRTRISRDITVTLPGTEAQKILTDGIGVRPAVFSRHDGFLLAFDIGTTTVAGYLLDGKNGAILARESALNPQTVFGGDVISRIGHALHGHMEELTAAIRRCLGDLTLALCEAAGMLPGEISRVGIVGNPAMQQLFLGISPDNLAKIPFAPVLKQVQRLAAEKYLPICPNAELLVMPNISGFVGGDTLACILATGLWEAEELTLLVDIGTNGEMVLGNRHRIVACSTAAGPALEGANIQFGMRGQTGAIDHVSPDAGPNQCSVIGGAEAVGICGSGIIDAVAVALDRSLINARGRIQREDRRIPLTDKIYLTQEDIRQVQPAKGAIAAGIALMAEHLGVAVRDIQQVYLAGAFGSYLDPSSACRIGLLPAELEGRIAAVGNAAGSGAQLLVCDGSCPDRADALVAAVEFLELAAVPGFQRAFAQHMRFEESPDYWCKKALSLGFSTALPLDITALKPRQDVRDMCAADKCRAYGKNWTCPPHCGTIRQCEAEIRSFSQGILLQTVGIMEKSIDTRAYRRTEEQHLRQFHALSSAIRSRYPAALCLGSGGCRICGECAWPAPCRFPEKACSSMEGYGLFVTQVCRDHGCPYHHGEKTITYTACILFSKNGTADS